MFLNQIKLNFFLCNILFISIIDFHVIRDVCGICIFILLINFWFVCCQINLNFTICDWLICGMHYCTQMQSRCFMKLDLSISRIFIVCKSYEDNFFIIQFISIIILCDSLCLWNLNLCCFNSIYVLCLIKLKSIFGLYVILYVCGIRIQHIWRIY